MKFLPMETVLLPDLTPLDSQKRQLDVVIGSSELSASLCLFLVLVPPDEVSPSQFTGMKRENFHMTRLL